MNKKERTFEGIGFVIVLLLWLIAMLAESPWWILIAMVGSAIVVVTLCRLALKH